MLGLEKNDFKAPEAGLSDSLRRCYSISIHLQEPAFSFDFEIADQFGLPKEQT